MTAELEKMTPENLATKVLSQIRKNDGEILFPIDPYKLLKEAGILFQFSDFEKLEGRRYYLKPLIEKIVSTAKINDLKIMK